MCRFNTRKAKRAVGWQQLWILQVEVFQLSKRHLCDFSENPPTSVDLRRDLVVINLRVHKLKLELLY